MWKIEIFRLWWFGAKICLISICASLLLWMVQWFFTLLFGWLPEWLFNTGQLLLAVTFLSAMLAAGIIETVKIPERR